MFDRFFASLGLQQEAEAGGSRADEIGSMQDEQVSENSKAAQPQRRACYDLKRWPDLSSQLEGYGYTKTLKYSASTRENIPIIQPQIRTNSS